ncbi:sulfate ABC transporter permease subunit CysT [Terrabacter aerolatus]|uniref:Sulfate transport system permease protein CysT n=1 Tax=Terrabacter aerolatus TaxID=422442 RepID=A0A512D4G3_9MICO|nr:sulfate ABC transporter permease subunit CysT [Terrabacter aerolatus]GEO31363.1 sulfate ABC transporter permease subunit CysT [Terrabacter aerolatus]
MTAHTDEQRGGLRPGTDAAPLPPRPDPTPTDGTRPDADAPRPDGAGPPAAGRAGSAAGSGRPRGSGAGLGGLRRPLGVGVVTLWLSVIVLLPLAALTVAAFGDGLAGFWDAVTAPTALAALWVTVLVSAIVALVNAVLGTLVAWVLVRDEFRGKRLVNAVIDLPFALPTIVASIVLLALYGPNSPIGVELNATRWGLVVALLFVTLPFVVRSVQPVLIEADREVEEAAASLGASGWTTFRRIVLPTLGPAILSGTGLAFARAIGEYGSVVLIGGNIPRDTQVASQYIQQQIEIDRPQAAAAVSVALLAIAFLTLFVLRVVSSRTQRREERDA